MLPSHTSLTQMYELFKHIQPFSFLAFTWLLILQPWTNLCQK